MNIVLAKQRAAASIHGGAAALIEDAVILPRQKLIDTVVRAQGGDVQAMRDAVNSSTRLVYSVCAGAWLKWSACLPDHASFDDVFLAGMEGLNTAIRKFDASRGNTLTTMATAWIHQACSREIHRQTGIGRIPERELQTGGVRKEMLAVNSISLDTRSMHGGRERIEEIMGAQEDETGIEVEDILRVLAEVDPRLPKMALMMIDGKTDMEIGDVFDVTRQRVQQLRQASQKALLKAGLAQEKK